MQYKGLVVNFTLAGFLLGQVIACLDGFDFLLDQVLSAPDQVTACSPAAGMDARVRGLSG